MTIQDIENWGMKLGLLDEERGPRTGAIIGLLMVIFSAIGLQNINPYHYLDIVLLVVTAIALIVMSATVIIGIRKKS